jgi:hypothetical protein
MALITQPGFTGFKYGRVSSMDGRAVGKFTDVNHLSSMHDTDPADYDKKIISLYTQSSLYSNDFLNMINQSTPYFIDGISDTWKWDINVPYRFPKIIAIPDSTYSQARIGIDGKEFEIITDSDEFAQNSIVSIGHRIFGPKIYAIEDPTPADGGAFVQKWTLISENPKVDFIDKQWLQPGKELELIDGSIGEFDQKLLGLPRMGDKITMFESLGSGYSFEHTITGWADDVTLVDQEGRPKDLLFFAQTGRNQLPITRNSVRWEPFIEYQLRKAMLELKVKRMIWSKPGTTKTRGSKQEVKKVSAGTYYRMRNNGNLVQFNRGEFSPNLIRSVFGDLFYRRVDVKDRQVKLYTNEAGFDTFQQAIKQDALNSGLTLSVDSGNKFIQGEGQHLVYNWAFESMITRETGKVELIHLRELDLPQTSDEFGQNKKSTPVYMVFDVSPNRDGSLRENIREVRKKGRPSMTWGYIDGRRHHLGFAKSQGHSAANKFDGYTCFFDDRADVFIEDLSRCVLIEELPQY